MDNRTWPKNKNVQEQIEERFKPIIEPARYFRKNYSTAIPQIIIDELSDIALDFEKDLIIYWDEGYAGDPNAHCAIVCTEANVFYDVYIYLNDDGTKVEDKKITDVTKKYPINDHQPGVGVTDGWLYAEALKIINNATQQNVSNNAEPRSARLR